MIGLNKLSKKNDYRKSAKRWIWLRFFGVIVLFFRHMSTFICSILSCYGNDFSNPLKWVEEEAQIYLFKRELQNTNTPLHYPKFAFPFSWFCILKTRKATCLAFSFNHSFLSLTSIEPRAMIRSCIISKPKVPYILII